MRISIHALREEGDHLFDDFLVVVDGFLSTPSARRATSSCVSRASRPTNFYPRPPRGGRPHEQAIDYCLIHISIHALREEGDRRRKDDINAMRKFLSTPSARRATGRGSSASTMRTHFYPRPPRGGRPSTCPRPSPSPRISIHALREEGDPCPVRHDTQPNRFLSTPSARRATAVSAFNKMQDKLFLSTPSARRATAKTERKPSAFVSLYTSLHKLQRGACKTNRKITPLLVQTAGIPVRSVRENHVRCLFALAGHQKISTLSCANSGCSPTCSTLVW